MKLSFQIIFLVFLAFTLSLDRSFGTEEAKTDVTEPSVTKIETKPKEEIELKKVVENNDSVDKPQPLLDDITNEQTDARSRALELAGAFGNDGYKIRDGFWTGLLELNKPVFLEVNLFAENRYWFCAGADSNARKISVSLFDAQGKPIQTNSYQSDNCAATGWIANKSGNYFVRLELLEGITSNVCFLYTYK